MSRYLDLHPSVVDDPQNQELLDWFLDVQALGGEKALAAAADNMWRKPEEFRSNWYLRRKRWVAVTTGDKSLVESTG
jgi:hypothetical protein